MHSKIIKYTEYLKSDEARLDFQAKSKNKLQNLNYQLERIKQKKIVAQESVDELNNSKLVGANNALLVDLQNGIVKYALELLRLNKEIEKELSKLDSGYYEDDFLDKVHKMVQENNETIKILETKIAKDEANLREHSEKSKKLKKQISELDDKGANLLAKKQLMSIPGNEDKVGSEATKMTFYVSANIARFGIVIITLFFAQVFISIYRYSSRLSDFYLARADILKLLHSELFESEVTSQLLEDFSRVFTPDNIDYWKPTKNNVDESIKTLAGLVKNK
ncbi:MAG: hypothetical protein QNK31_06265 [Porticoccus sp.]|nr:hypothetical protein [Porticoccus sp.]